MMGIVLDLLRCFFHVFIADKILIFANILLKITEYKHFKNVFPYDLQDQQNLKKWLNTFHPTK